MDDLVLRIVEKILIIYFSLYLLIDIALFFYSLAVFRRRKTSADNQTYNYAGYPISLIVPAYNEEVSIADCTRMLLEIDYPNFEVIVVNDGSSDNTLAEMEANFSLVPHSGHKTAGLATSPVRCVYAGSRHRLLLIDKENGGKADSINAGINYATGDYICTIDADSILDPLALKEVIKPFIRKKNTMVSGGQLAASNGVVLKNNRLVSSSIPRNIWVLWQIIEYIKSFMVSRIGLSRINALLIMSGAFSLYRKDELLSIGGFLTARNKHPYIRKTIGTGKQTVCEDMEIVVRLFRYRREKQQKASAVFLPRPVCWTEVPDNSRNLFRQRSRWHQGLAETLKIHRDMIFEPRFGTTGLVGLPYYFFFELLAPIVKVFTLLFVIAAIIYGTVNYQWAVLLIVSVMLLSAIIMSAMTAVIEYWSVAQTPTNRDALRYKTFRDWMWLITAGIIGEFSYSFFKIVAQIEGFINFLKRKNNWKKFERKGLKTEL